MKAFSWQLAEALAATHMQSIGFPDSQTTGSGTDRGIDVVSESAVAQVKAHSAPVGAPDVQRLRGASHEKEEALFYSLSGYTSQALEFAEISGVSLFTFDSSNNVEPANSHALRLIVSSQTTAVEEQIRKVLENHLSYVNKWTEFMKYLTEWLLVSPWGLHMPIELGDELAECTDDLAVSAKWPSSLTVDTAPKFLRVVEKQKTAIEVAIRKLGEIIGVDFQGLTPSKCKQKLQSILEGNISEFRVPEHLIPILDKFPSHEEGWKNLAECNRVVRSFRKFLHVVNANNKTIDVPSLADHPPTKEAWKESMEIVARFGEWGNRAFDQGGETAEVGEQLIKEFTFAYGEVIAVFGQNVEKLWKKSQKLSATDVV